MKNYDLEKSLNFIWISRDIFLETNLYFFKELYYIVERNCYEYESFRFFRYANYREAIKNIIKLKFQPTIIILEGSIYFDFIKLFNKNLRYIKIIPKIIVLTHEDKIKRKIIDRHYNNIKFYNYSGNNTSFFDLKKCIINEINYKKPIRRSKRISNSTSFLDDGFTFEYIDDKAKILLPMFYQTLIEDIPNKEKNNFNNYLYSISNYDKIINSLKSFISIPDIPLELLSKYYIRIYTYDCGFYKDLNFDLRNNRFEQYFPYIITIYKGIELKCLDLGSDKTLYRSTLLSNNEISFLQEKLKEKKNENLPSVIVFSKCFLSFSKDLKECLKFMSKKSFPDKSNVLLEVEKDESLDYSFSTHADIEQLSYFPDEKEVLFFPFSSFEVQSIEDTKINNRKAYKLKLFYLGKYLKELTKDENFIKSEEKLPKSNFRQSLEESKLIKLEQIDDLTNIKLFNEYVSYNINIYPEIENALIEEEKKGIDNSLKNLPINYIGRSSGNIFDDQMNKEDITINKLKVIINEKEKEKEEEEEKKEKIKNKKFFDKKKIFNKKFFDKKTIFIIIFIILLILLFIFLSRVDVPKI